jgi:aspartate aminotransferase-like enzyme
MVSHRSPEFENAHATCQRGVAAAFGTDTVPVLINGNGWVGVETAMAGVLRPDDDVVAVQTGKFGKENGDVAEQYAPRVHRIRHEWGTPVDLGRLRNELTASTDVVTMVHCETSTGLVNSVPEVAALADEHDALLFVDGVSSIGGEQFAFDEWGVDVAVTASQKALGGPPGISAIALSDRARERASSTGCPFSLDLGAYLDELERNQTPSTAPVPIYFALAKAVEPFIESDADARIALQRRLASALRAGMGVLGVEPFPRPNEYAKLSDTVQVLALPDGVSEETMLNGLAARNVSIRGGLGRLEGETIRIATMGAKTGIDDIVRTIGAVGEVLVDEGQVLTSSTVADARMTAREAFSDD